MFDIEKAKSRGLDPAQIEIMQKINENSIKRDNCKKHDFVEGSRPGGSIDAKIVAAKRA